MKPFKFLFLCGLALSLFGTKVVFAEGVDYKCLSTHEMLSALADEEICSDLDITNKDKLSSCLQRKYIFLKENLDLTFNKLVSEPEKNINTAIESKAENEIDFLLSFFKKKPVEIQGFVEQRNLNSIAQDSEKKEELIKEQVAWNEKLLYECMDAAKGVENDPYPLLVIKGCLVGMTEDRIAYLNGLL